jgi:hypothetical protein
MIGRKILSTGTGNSAPRSLSISFWIRSPESADMLARAAERITLRDVLDATAGPICLMACVDTPGACTHSSGCTSRQVWLAITADMREVLARYSLCDLAKRPCTGCRSDVQTARDARARGQRKTKARLAVKSSAAPSRRVSAPANGRRIPPPRKTGVRQA